MEWFPYRIAKVRLACQGLTVAEEGCLRRLLDWCYDKEGPLTSNIRELRKLTGCQSPNDRHALDAVLQKFFVLQPDGYHNEQVDKDLAKFHAKGNPVEMVTDRSASAKRARAARERRSELYEKAHESGLSPHWNMTTEQLKLLLAGEVVTAPVTAPRKPQLTPVTAQAAQPVTAVSEFRSKNDILPYGRMSTQAGEACKAMRVAGIADTNPSHPGLRDLLAKGVTVEALAMAAAEAASRRKGFAYALKIAENRATEQPADGPPRALDRRQTRDQALAATWAPALSRDALLGDSDASVLEHKP